MKKYILVLIFSIITVTAFAQTIRYGVVAGINKNTVVYDNNSSPSEKSTGYNFGLIIDMAFGDFILQPGVLFIKNGRDDVKYTYSGGMLTSTQYVGIRKITYTYQLTCLLTLM
jgi:hypothetical protein